MNEIFTIADRYTVFRNGRFIKTGNISDTNPEEVTLLMVGGSSSASEIYHQRELGEVVLKLENYSGPGFENINLEVKKGEVVGLTGLLGAGASEMLQAVFGAINSTSGKVYVEGKQLRGGIIHEAMVNKVAMIAANRKENSIIPDFSLLDNNSISSHMLTMKKMVIHKKREIERYNMMKKKLNIKSIHDHNDLIVALSGGNQQKVILARWLTTEADILLMDNPTQGIDVGAKAEIYKLIMELANQGKTILVNTLEIPEIQMIADRCVVFYHGHVQTILDRSDISEENVMLYATNVKGA